MSPMYSTFYLMLKEVTVNRNQLLHLTGINPDAPIEILNRAKIAPVEDTPVPEGDIYDIVLTGYNLVLDPTGEGEIAIPVYDSVPKDLATAKEIAALIVKERYTIGAAEVVIAESVGLDILTGAASQDLVDRPAVYETILGDINLVGGDLNTTLQAIASATTVDEIRDILYPPAP